MTGKTLTYVLAFADGAPIVDVTPSYSTDWDATLAAREVSPRCLSLTLQAAADSPWPRRLMAKVGAVLS